MDDTPRIELVLNGGSDILVLDGTVLEAFKETTAASRRWHVRHVKVASKPRRRGDGHTVYIGWMTSGTFPDAWTIDVSDAELAHVEELVRIIHTRAPA